MREPDLLSEKRVAFEYAVAGFAEMVELGQWDVAVEAAREAYEIAEGQETA